MRPFILLWLFGLCLRTTVLAVPPVIPMIHQSLALSQAEIGALASLPVLLFSFAAVPGSILIARFGAFRVLVGGILLTGLGSALRGAAPDAAMLFAATFVMGIGIAIMQPSLPPVVREWVPRKIALGTAVYSNGLLMGEALAASLTIPVVLPLAGGDWRLALVAWSVPIFLVALAGMLHQRGRPAEPMHEKARMVARLEVAGHVAPRAHLRRVLEHLLHHQRVPPGRAASRGKARAAESRALREQLAADSRVAAAALLSREAHDAALAVHGDGRDLHAGHDRPRARA